MKQPYDTTVFLTEIGDLRIETVISSEGLIGGEVSNSVHAHAYYELLVALEGDYFVELAEGERVVLTKDSACLISPDTYHCTRRNQTIPRVLGIRFYYSRGEGTPSIYDSFDRELQRKCFPRVFREDCELFSLLHRLAEEFKGNDFASELYAQTLFTQFYLCMARLLIRTNPVKTQRGERSFHDNEQNRRRLFLEDVFCNRYTEPLSEDSISKEMNLSKRQLNRVLQEIYGKGFRQLLVESRLHHGAQLLLTTDRSVEDIAYTVGYSSISGFYSAFRQQYGVSVGRYRRQWAAKD